MRLIDADALNEKLWQARVQYQMLDDTQTADKIMRGIHRSEQILADAPTIDAVPVKHGVWEKVKYEDDDGYFYLYVHKDCGCEQARERNYCPNCGAKMDGERKDDDKAQ